MDLTSTKITWANFEAYNDTPRTSFEDLCRLLFQRKFFATNKNFNSRPNHPGVEILPVFEENSGKRISFQAKFFSGAVDYSQIKHSIEKTIDYHADDLDIFYLYCNKDIDINAKGYKQCEILLNSKNIEIQVIANNAIRDQVFVYPEIGEYFFGHHSLSEQWFKERLDQSLNSMGTRYNKLFNVSTETEKSLKLFLRNSETLKIIKEKKNEAISELIGLRKHLSGNNEQLINDIISKIKTYEINDAIQSEKCLGWKYDLQATFSKQFDSVNDEIKIIENIKLDSQQKEQENRIKLYCLRSLVNSPLLLEFDSLEQNLIKSKILVVNGEAGTGKTQLLSDSASGIIKSNGRVILLPGQALLSSGEVSKQILSYLDISFGFREFLEIIETFGEISGDNAYIFIDAINESGKQDIWKSGLSNIVREIEKLNFVKLVISLRSGYEDLVFDDNIKQKLKTCEIPQITHRGFQDDSIEAVKEFLNHYNIPFSPSDTLQTQMVNPLFLTMFCKTYDGNEFNYNRLLEKFFEASDKEAQKIASLPFYQPMMLSDLIKEISEYQLENKTRTISKHKVLDLDFWNHYGLIGNKLSYLMSLTKSGIFLVFVREGEEILRFGYNLLEDFVYAKTIINKFSAVQRCKEYLKDDLLGISDEAEINWQYTDTFTVATSLFFVKFHEECIDIVDNIVEEYERNHLLDEYIKSFSWRSSKYIDSKAFRDFINKKEIDTNTVFSVLIENSAKIDHPLNAEFLHEILIDKPLNERDYLWTTYINGVGYDDERLFQLISFFDEGKKLDNLRENTWLLLVLFSWLLTSSNRLLRDKAAKAMIELLKDDFSLSLPLLKKFENVNDPYVIQRLYGVVFGACTKNLNMAESEFKELVEYIYTTIFDKDLVYPDILLRDYAKLIIEYFLFKFPESETIINETIFRPPYNSESIPIAKKAKDKYDGGLNIIAYSMAPEGVDRMYGDFGRYVFDSALGCFSDADRVNIYNYSMDFIENKLGYKNELFTEHDRFQNRYDRHSMGKIERIGKKYQWITMYNILARVSDHYKLSDRYSWNNNKEPEEFEGAWNPYVRDFDPTLNRNFLDNPNLPVFSKKEQRGLDFIEKNSSRETIKEWVNNENDDFFTQGADLLLADQLKNEWIVLDDYVNVKNNDDEIEPIKMGDRSGEQEKWIITSGYFVKKSKFSALKKELSNKNLREISFSGGSRDIYQLFNREYGWSTGYKISTNYSWLDYEVETGEFNTIEYPDINISYFDDNKLEVESVDAKTKKVKVPIRKSLAKVMPTTDRFLWEEQYDASQNETTSFDVPCNLLINELKLEQREYDGYYYDKSGELVAFYIKDNEKFDSSHRFLIRKKYLDQFLCQNELVMFWICRAEKNFLVEEMDAQEWSEWSGLLYLSNDKIVGEIVKIHKK